MPSNRCDWGTVAAPAFASSISSDIVTGADTLIAVFDAGISETTLVIKPTGNSLHVETYDRFKDNSGRSNYLASYAFQKAQTPGEVIPGAVPTPIDLSGVWNCDDGGKYYVRQLETRSGGMESLIPIHRTCQIL